jgi:hypothetical protein
MIDVDLSPNSPDIRKLKWQARSNIKFRTIIEALKIYYGHKDEFGTVLKSRGWEDLGFGYYKRCMAKNSIVVKFPKELYYDQCLDERKKEIAREYDQWINPPSIDFRKYLPRTYVLIDGIFLIQDRVLGKCIYDPNYGYNVCTCLSEVESLAATYDLQDYYQNHGHTLKGNIKFFDSVWNRWRKI